MSERWFEDHVPGTTTDHGPLRVLHVDAEAAAAGPVGVLIASGWHLCALVVRLLADEHLSPGSSLGSPGVDELRRQDAAVVLTMTAMDLVRVRRA